MTNHPKFRVGELPPTDSMVGLFKYAIVVGGKVVIETRANGSGNYMTFKSRNRANQALQRVRIEGLAGAVVYEA